MNIKDIQEYWKKYGSAPLVCLSSGYTLDDSFDPGFQVYVGVPIVEDTYDTGKCYEVQLTCTKDLVEKNRLVGGSGWRHPKTGLYNGSYFDVHSPNSQGDYVETAYVMENDDFCDLMEAKEQPVDRIAELEAKVKQLEFRLEGIISRMYLPHNGPCI